MFLDAESNRQVGFSAPQGVKSGSQPVPKPGEDSGGGFAEASGDVDELRLAGLARVAARQPTLVVVGFVPRRRLKELLESHHLPPALTQRQTPETSPPSEPLSTDKTVR